MNLSCLASCLVALIALAHGDDEWEAWKAEYGRNYASHEEEVLRHKAFLENMVRVRQNQEANPLASFGSDEFSDWTESELTGLYGAIPEESADILEASVNMSEAIPDSKDWTGIATTPVKKQKCGSCWANSAVAQIESDFILQKGATFILSPQELVDCKGDGSFNNGCMMEHTRQVCSLVVSNWRPTTQIKAKSRIPRSQSTPSVCISRRRLWSQSVAGNLSAKETSKR